MKKKKSKVFVGLSGGVDSAVSAALLKREGYEVVGVFIQTWHPDFLPCNEEGERRDAMRVAARLDIPLLTFDFEKVYKRAVADYMISEYRFGRTPNPDVMCNKEVKFGAFLNEALRRGADFIATGHYARVLSRPAFFSGPRKKSPDHSKNSGRLGLERGVDLAKDQSYFLWTLTQKQLSKVLFPVGNLKKEEVRRLAKKFNLPVSEKKDSQGICFLGEVDLKKFLKHYIKEKIGTVLNEHGEEIGSHEGVFFHTLGERRGFSITKKTPRDKPYYIIGKDVKKNVLVVSHNKISHSNILTNVGIKKTNWIQEPPKSNKKYSAQVRYHGDLLSCKVKLSRFSLDKDVAEVLFEKPALVASGQSCVIYDGDICLGGGVVV